MRLRSPSWSRAIGAIFLALAPAIAFANPWLNASTSEQTHALCEGLLDAEHDIFQANPSMTSELPIMCASMQPETTVEATVRAVSEIDFAGTLGAILAERRNKWGWWQERTYMTVSNPYHQELNGLFIRAPSGSCEDDTTADAPLLRVDFSSPIPPRETRIVRFSFLDTHVNGFKTSCILIVGTLPSPDPDPTAIPEKVHSLLAAGDWHEAGLAVELLLRSEIGLSIDLRKSLANEMKPVAASIPRADMVANRDAYDFLLSLEPDNPKYAAKVSSYQNASIKIREQAVKRQVLLALPEISLPDVIAELSPSRTEAQRTAAWQNIEGKRLELIGQVTDVIPEGLLLNASIKILLKSNITATCHVKESLNDIAQSIEAGDKIKCVGELENYTALMGSLHLRVIEAALSP